MFTILFSVLLSGDRPVAKGTDPARSLNCNFSITVLRSAMKSGFLFSLFLPVIEKRDDTLSCIVSVNQKSVLRCNLINS